MRTYLGGAVVLGFLAAGPPAQAWNDAGHKTVALLAFREPVDGWKVRAIQILEKHPHFELFLDKDRPSGVDRNEWIFVRAATWPDFVRPKKGHPRPGIDEFHLGDHHFIDRPVIPTGQEGDFDLAKLEPKAPHALSALDEAAAKLKAADTPDKDRAVCRPAVLAPPPDR
jgi:hypothetical protein